MRNVCDVAYANLWAVSFFVIQKVSKSVRVSFDEEFDNIFGVFQLHPIGKLQLCFLIKVYIQTISLDTETNHRSMQPFEKGLC